MPITPLIRTLQVNGGTFYAFSSAAKDETKVKANEDLKFEYSKFVALKIPNFDKLDFSTFSHYENYMQLNTIDGMIWNGGLSGDLNVDLSTSLQSYVMNMEALMLSDDDYDSTIKKSISERIFFKWLKETGAIRFRDANTREKSGGVTGSKFVEENTVLTGTERYSRVVQYVGDLDIMNSVEKAGETYTELYIRIPTQVGHTPTILFDAYSDDNYKPNLVITGEGEYLHGRSATTIHPDGLSKNAFYDYDSSVVYTDPNANWHNEPPVGGNVNSYFTELTEFDNPLNTDIKKYWADYDEGANGVAYRRSSLDGISLDFEPSNYYDIVNDPIITTIQQYNGAGNSTHFEFNAILIYYDIYNTSDVSDRATNLYGVLFLDNVIPTSEGGYIQTFQKFKPSTVTGLNGNSYGLSINMKNDVSISNDGIFTIVNEYNNFSMGLFSEATAQLQEASKLFTNNAIEIEDVKERLTALETNAYAIYDIQSLSERMNAVETMVNNAQLAFADSTSILDLIASNAQDLQNFINGQTSVEISYNSDVMQGGNGIILDKSVNNRVIVNNSSQSYTLNTVYDIGDNIIDSESGNELDLNVYNLTVTLKLVNFTNMCRIYVTNSAINNMSIYIDDSIVRFKKGQVVRFVFPNDLEMNGYSIKIYTDKNDNFGLGEYGKLISTLTTSDFIDTKPIIELICLDERVYTFDFDVIK